MSATDDEIETVIRARAMKDGAYATAFALLQLRDSLDRRLAEVTSTCGFETWKAVQAAGAAIATSVDGVSGAIAHLASVMDDLPPAPHAGPPA